MKLKFKKEDCWIGLYWNDKYVYVCLIPCFPIQFKRIYWTDVKLFFKRLFNKERCMRCGKYTGKFRIFQPILTKYTCKPCKEEIENNVSLKVSGFKIKKEGDKYIADGGYLSRKYYKADTEDDLLKQLCEATKPETCDHCDGDLEYEEGDHSWMTLSCNECIHYQLWTQDYNSGEYHWEEGDVGI